MGAVPRQTAGNVSGIKEEQKTVQRAGRVWMGAEVLCTVLLTKIILGSYTNKCFCSIMQVRYITSRRR